MAQSALIVLTMLAMLTGSQNAHAQGFSDFLLNEQGMEKPQTLTKSELEEVEQRVDDMADLAVVCEKNISILDTAAKTN